MEALAARVATMEKAMGEVIVWVGRAKEDVMKQVCDAAAGFIDHMEKKSTEASSRIDQISQGCNQMLVEVTAKHAEVLAWQQQTQARLAEFESRTNQNVTSLSKLQKEEQGKL